MKEYKEYIIDLARQGKNVVFDNSGPEHASLVMATIFDNAKENVRIYAGNFSGHVSEKEEYRASLEKYLSKGGKLKILLEEAKFQGPEKEPKVFDILRYYSIINPEQVSIKLHTTKVVREENGDKENDPHEIHFTVADDKMYRIEDNIDTFVAFGNFNDLETSKKLVGVFDEIFDGNQAKLYNLITVKKPPLG